MSLLKVAVVSFCVSFFASAFVSYFFAVNSSGKDTQQAFLGVQQDPYIIELTTQLDMSINAQTELAKNLNFVLVNHAVVIRDIIAFLDEFGYVPVYERENTSSNVDTNEAETITWTQEVE